MGDKFHCQRERAQLPAKVPKYILSGRGRGKQTAGVGLEAPFFKESVIAHWSSFPAP